MLYICKTFGVFRFSWCVEVREKVPHNVVGGLVEIIGEDRIFNLSEFIFKGEVLFEKEIGIKDYVCWELQYIYYADVFTFEVEEIYYSEDPSIKVGDVIKVANASCSNDWIPGTIEIEKDKHYIVLTQKSIDTGTTDFTKYFDYATVDHWSSIILVEDGKYYIDEGLESLTGNTEEEFIREDEYFNTTVYVKGEEFEDELKDLILKKKKENK